MFKKNQKRSQKCTPYKNTHLSPQLCASLAQGVKILTREVWVRPTYDWKILSGPVKVCRRFLRKADFEQIHITMHDSVR